jgi:hypothetical protein
LDFRKIFLDFIKFILPLGHHQTNKNTVIMTFEITVGYTERMEAVDLLRERGYAFSTGTAEHTDDMIIYLRGGIGDLDAAEKLLASENLAYTF